MRTHLPLFLTVIAVFLAISGAGAPSAQEQPAAADSADGAPQDTIPPDLASARELMAELEASLDSIYVIESRMKGADEDKREVLRAKGRRYVEKIDEDQPKLLDLIAKLDADSIPSAEIKRRFRHSLAGEADAYERSLTWWARKLDDLRDLRAKAAPEDLGDIEGRINETRSTLDKVLLGRAKVLTVADSLGMDTEQYWDQLESILKNRAESLVGRLQIAVKTRGQLERKVRDAGRARTPESEIGADRKRLQYAKRRVEGVASSLEETVDLLEARGFESTQYRQFIIETTGEITEKILDPKVLFGILSNALKDFWNWIKENAPAFLIKVLIVLAFVVVFRILFRLSWWIVRLLGLAKLSRLMRDLVDRMLRPIATIVGLISGLWFLGVNPTHLLAGVGVASVIIGLALQDSLSNLAAGFFILATRPFDVDDVVVSGSVFGTVKEMGLANTTIVTFDNRRLMVPNRKIWGEVIENRSAELVRRVEIEVRIGYKEDLDRSLEILRDLLDKNERVLKKPEPLIFVSELADSWIEIAVRPWVRNEDWWPLLTELPRLVRLRFAEEGIEIPIPRREVTMPPEEKEDTKKPDVD
jgi:small conductance mechanosensitive channel